MSAENTLPARNRFRSGEVDGTYHSGVVLDVNKDK
jgi:hypothetical protein